MSATTIESAAPLPVRRAWTRPRATSGLVTEAAMWAYGAGMMCWFMLTVMSGPAAGDGSLAPLWTVLAVWAVGIVPAYGAARLVARGFPRA